MARDDEAHARREERDREIRRHAEILEAVADGAQRLMRAEDWRETMDGVLACLGRAADVCRAYLFENRTPETGRILTSQRYEWVREGVVAQIDNPDLQDVDFVEGGYVRWIERLGAGESIAGRVRDLPEEERPALEAQGILSIVVVPVFCGRHWWGFIGFDACRAEREWSPPMIDALRAAAGIIGAAIRRERLETERQTQQRLLREVFEGVQEGIGIVDAEERIVFCNAAYARIFDEEPDAFPGHDLREYLDAEARATIRRETKTRRRGESSLYHLPIVTRTGRRRLLRVAASPRFDDAGTYLGAFGSVLDITEMSRTEAALHESEAMWRSVVENTPDTILDLDRDLVVRFANRVSHGLAPEALIGQPLLDHLSADERDRVGEILRAVLAGGEPASYETVYDAPDGGRYHYEARVAGRSVGGEVVGLTLSTRDVTERRRAEEALRESERKYRGLVDNALVGFVQSRADDGTILFVNDALVRAAGFDSREAMMAEGALPRYRDPAERAEMIHRLRAEGRVEAFPTTVVTKGGEVRHGLISARLDGNILTSVILDNTEQCVAEEKLREYSARLEEMVEERTRELQEVHEQLLRRERLATLGQLAGGVGHELRNPLGAIRNAAYFLDMTLESPDAEVREAIEVLRDQVTTSDRIIGSLLDFARQDRPALSDVSLEVLVTEVLDGAEVPGAIRVERNFDPRLPVIRGDVVQLRQVIGNLVINALQSMPKGGVLGVSAEPSGPSWVALSVSDTGVGIAEEHRARVFAPLFTTRSSGIGLGLANSRRFVEMHGGTIRFRDRKGPGTVFTIRLPVEGPKEGQSAREATPGSGMGRTPGDEASGRSDARGGNDGFSREEDP